EADKVAVNPETGTLIREGVGSILNPFCEYALDMAVKIKDDNPDIEKYLGNGQLGMVWQLSRNHNLELMLRNNLRSDNKGAIELGWTYPFATHFRGYVQYFNGYGESLIYYNVHSERLSLGIKFTDWL
ncbi:MAG: phospholipase A, partial [Gammaproteobacteria bacterium]